MRSTMIYNRLGKDVGRCNARVYSIDFPLECAPDNRPRSERSFTALFHPLERVSEKKKRLLQPAGFYPQDLAAHTALRDFFP